MKKWLWVVALCVCAGNARGQYVQVGGYVSQGGSSVVVGGLPPTAAKFMQTYPGAQVTVCISGTSCASLAAIYSSATGTSKSNPFTSDPTTAAYQFFTAPGTIDLRFSGTGISTPFTISGLIVGLPGCGMGNCKNVLDVTIPPYNADPTGTNDSTAGIQAAINNFTNGRSGATASGKVIFPPGTYSIASTLTYVGAPGHSIVFEGATNSVADPGSTIYWNGAAGATMFEMMAGREFEFRNLTFDLNNSARIGLQIAADNAINTTLGTNVSPGSQTFTPGAIGNLGVGTLVSIDSGSNFEMVYITAIAGGNATATFTKSHASTAQVGNLGGSSGGVLRHVFAINVPTSATDWATLPGTATAGIVMGNVMPSATSQISEMKVYSPTVNAYGSGGASAGIAIIGGGNVKNFWLYDISINGFQYGIDNPQGSGTLNVIGGSEGSTTVADFRINGANGGQISGVECESTTGHQFLVGTGSNASQYALSLIGNSFQSQATSSDYVISYPWLLNLFGNTFYNSRTGASVAKIQCCSLPLIGGNGNAGITSFGNWYENASGYAPFYDGSNNALLPYYYNSQPVSATSAGDTGGSTGTPVKLSNYLTVSAITSQQATYIARSGVVRCGTTDTCMAARNNANSADIPLVAKNSSDVTVLGGAAGVSVQGIASSGTVSGTGFSNYFASPPAIGGTAAAAGTFSSLNSGRIIFGKQTLQTTAAFTLTGWGTVTGESVASNSKDQSGALNFTTGTASLNPTALLVFVDGSFGSGAPVCFGTFGGNGATVLASAATTSTQVTFTFQGTPANSTGYQLTWHCFSGD